jgi:hypothetical protein
MDKRDELDVAVPDDELDALEAEDAERKFPRINPNFWAEINQDRAEGKAVTYRMLEGARHYTWLANAPRWSAALQRSPKFGPKNAIYRPDPRRRLDRCAPRVRAHRDRESRPQPPRRRTGRARSRDPSEPEPPLAALRGFLPASVCLGVHLQRRYGARRAATA